MGIYPSERVEHSLSTLEAVVEFRVNPGILWEFDAESRPFIPMATKWLAFEYDDDSAITPVKVEWVLTRKMQQYDGTGLKTMEIHSLLLEAGSLMELAYSVGVELIGHAAHPGDK